MNAVTKIKPDGATPVDQLDTFAKAFVKLQAAIKPAIKDAENDAFKRAGKGTKYADLGAVWEAIKAPLADNGFAIIQSPDFDGADMWLKTTILHISGDTMEGRYPLRPTKNDPQGYGSALTYARRYSISAMLGVIADDDDDGNAASGVNGKPLAPTGKISATQLEQLIDLLTRVDADIPKFCQHFKIEAVTDLPAAKFSTAVEMLNLKGANK